MGLFNSIMRAFSGRSSDDDGLEQKSFQTASAVHNTDVRENNSGVLQSHSTSTVQELTQYEKELAQQGNLIGAVKEVRERTRLGLAEAKKLVDEYIRNGDATAQSQSNEHTHGELDDASLTDKEKEFIVRNQPITAIKMVRERTGLSLIEAKRLVDSYSTLT